MEESLTLEKSQTLRNNEYYKMQEIVDEIYSKAKMNKTFKNLMKYIVDEKNILLAYRNIKKNKGSLTYGTDNKNIKYFENMKKEKFILSIQQKLRNYNPKSIKRVEIPKANGDLRPLGIPCIEDRLIQQCIKQIIEPICEAKFHKHSYGFRPNRSTSHAIARCMALINKSKLHYVVDIDIKGFFDNVNHSKLKKQLWSLGIQDKNLIAIIDKILKSEIKGVGIPIKGTPQGGIISPLLANIVLNELDWWISSQWESFETKRNYSGLHRYKFQKQSKLKEVWLVRYADDFKIFCRDYKVAQRIFQASKMWLKERLDLDVSTEKSKITNLRKNYSEFLGFKLTVKLKSKKYICISRMTNKANKQIRLKVKEQLNVIKNTQSKKEIIKLNSMILGWHNYYRYATHISKDFAKIDFLVRKTVKHKLRNISSFPQNLSETYKRLYGNYKGKIKAANGIAIFPIYACKHKSPMCFSQEICNYTKDGRKLIHSKLNKSAIIIEYLLNNIYKEESTEFNDNKISLMAGQQGKCYVTGENLRVDNMICHHKIPKNQGGSDAYNNLVWVNAETHELIHSKIVNTLKLKKLEKNRLKRLNSLRKLVGNSVI